jgi:hypothetical protein
VCERERERERKRKEKRAERGSERDRERREHCWLESLNDIAEEKYYCWKHSTRNAFSRVRQVSASLSPEDLRLFMLVEPIEDSS